MKSGGGGQLEKTKVVVRHLHPGFARDKLMEVIDSKFSGRYNWVSFRPGKISHKRQTYSRLYIDFNSPDDVFDFAEFFVKRPLMDEKGNHCKVIVEYAPYQRVPKESLKKDGREGTILKDPAYLEFLEFISKPVEHLPSAEIQLERKEVERAGAPKDAPIITPLMDFVRQKRAAKRGPRRILSNGKLSRRSGASGSPSTSSSKRSSERKTSKKMYVLRDDMKNTSGKEKPTDKSTYILLSKRDDEQSADKAGGTASPSGAEVLEDEIGVCGITDTGKKKILLLKGKEGEILHLQNVTASNSLRQNQLPEASGRIIRSILSSKDSHRSQFSAESEQPVITSKIEKDKRPPRPRQNGVADDRAAGSDLHGFSGEKLEKRSRNKGRPDRVVWTTLRRSDGSYAGDESLSSLASQSTQSGLASSQGNSGDKNTEISNSRGGEVRNLDAGHVTHSQENGSHKHFGRRGQSHSMKDTDSSAVEIKSSKRAGGASGYSSSEKQVWVQKSSSGS